MSADLERLDFWAIFARMLAARQAMREGGSAAVRQGDERS